MRNSVPERYYGAMLKLHRAADHLEDIARKVADFEKPTPWQIETETIENGVVYRVHFTSQPPVLGCEIGDYLHNMRSALDIATCTLIEHFEPTANLGNVQFPIARDSVQLQHKERSRLLNIPPAIQVIETVRAKHQAALLALQDLSNQDKHRLITTAVVRAQAASVIVDPASNTASIVCSPDVDPTLWQTPLQSGDVVGRGRLPGMGITFRLALMVDGHAYEITILNTIRDAVATTLHYFAFGNWPDIDPQIPKASSAG